ncbi:MAG: hypothetical protein ACRCXC_09520 [Legionella sp.]
MIRAAPLNGKEPINPSVRQDEIAYYKQQLTDSEHFIQSSALKLQALRVVINKV